MRELFIEDLDRVMGGGKPPKPPFPCTCCNPTTMACCEEAECDTCCPPTS